MQTAEEIVLKIESLDVKDSFEDLDGRRRSRLISMLPYEHARKWLKPETTEEEWEVVTEHDLRTEARTDLTFAWEKTLGHRGISADMMAGVMKDWIWLLCSEEDYVRLCEVSYPNYGAPILAMAGQLLDLTVEIQWPEEAGRMAAGQKCKSYCDEGCGVSFGL